MRAVALPIVAAVAVAVAGVALRSGAPAPPARAAAAGAVRAGHVRIAIRNYAFAPPAVTVRVGARVTWTNDDATAHTATADHGAFDTGTVGPHGSHTVDLSRPGVYTYHCVFHAFMTATVRVVR
jgi:plastocyanin